MMVTLLLLLLHLSRMLRTDRHSTAAAATAAAASRYSLCWDELRHPIAWLGLFGMYIFSAFYILGSGDDDGGDPIFSLRGISEQTTSETEVGDGGCFRFYFCG